MGDKSANVQCQLDKEITGTGSGELWPKLILFLLPENCFSEMIKLPQKFIEEHGKKLPNKLILQLPNGREFYVDYFIEKESLSNPSLLIAKFKKNFGIVLVLSYVGIWRFLVVVLNDDRMENEYGSPVDCGYGSRTLQDTMGGKGWSFFQLATGFALVKGAIEIPSTYVDRFGGIIPRRLNLRMINEDVLDGCFLPDKRHISGLYDIVSRKYVNQCDIMLLTYRGDADFDMYVFTPDGVEKSHKIDVIEIDSDSDERFLFEGIYSDDEVQKDGEDTEFGGDIVDVPAAAAIRQFSAVLAKCHVDKKTHGLCIPENINPTSRCWQKSDQVILRTNDGSWTIGIVMNKKRERFSAGWNKFIRENTLELDDVLNLTLLEEDGRMEFLVEKSGT